MNSPAQLRKQVRVILSALPGTRAFVAEPFLLESINRFFPEKTSTEELNEALIWNQSRGFIDYRFNEDNDRREWFLTAEGKQKEGL